jgi:predicted NodU family carbamoyl transferase
MEEEPMPNCGYEDNYETCDKCKRGAQDINYVSYGNRHAQYCEDCLSDVLHQMHLEIEGLKWKNATLEKENKRLTKLKWAKDTPPVQAHVHERTA